MFMMTMRSLAVTALAAAVAGCSTTATTTTERRSAAPSTTVQAAPTSASPTSTPAPTSTAAAAAAAADCGPLPDGVQKLIDGSFTGGENLQDAFAVAGPGNFVYVGGNIMGSDGTKESSADVWLVKDEGIYVVYALSSDARKRTSWPDGRDLASAGDEYGSAVQDCVTAAERARNLGGG